jgi:hypothetical protein
MKDSCANENLFEGFDDLYDPYLAEQLFIDHRAVKTHEELWPEKLKLNRCQARIG